MSYRQVCVLGAGNLGRALIGGLLRSGTRPEQLRVAEPAAAARTALQRDFGISASDSAEAVAGADLVVLAVKPQEARAVLMGVAAPLVRSRPLLISVAAGVRIATLSACCPGVPLLRAMPNRPALIGAGVSGLYAPPQVSAAQRQDAQRVLAAVGEVVWLEAEEQLDVVTALSGSGPAYFFLLAELLAAGATQLGLTAESAQRLAAATLYGSGLMAQGAAGELSALRAAVTSPQGTTAAALEVFAAAQLPQIVQRALAAATHRARELGGAGA
jgi:pyrroline-5-carboxylate reductase